MLYQSKNKNFLGIIGLGPVGPQEQFNFNRISGHDKDITRPKSERNYLSNISKMT